MAKVCLCGGESPSLSEPVSVLTVLTRLDQFFGRNDLLGAREFLAFWEEEYRRAGDDASRLTVVNEAIGVYRKLQDQEGAFSAIARAETLLRRLNMEETLSAATIYLNIGTAYCAFGRTEEALVFDERAERIYAKDLDAKDPRRAALFNNKAAVLEELGRLTDAEAAYLWALGLTEKVPGRQNDAAVTLVNLAHLKERQGAEEAETDGLLDRAMACLDDPRLPWDGAYAFVCEKCAPSFGHFGWFEKQRDLSERARKIYERA